MAPFNPGEAYGPAVQAHLASMRTGNAAKQIPRDLSLRKGEFWQTRQVPVRPHHFTSAEYANYLSEQRFPGNTIDDRMCMHVQCIRHALATGIYVPAAVMCDPAGIEALALAEMDVKALAEHAFKAGQTKQARALFEAALGYDTPGGDPEAIKRTLLLNASRAEMHAVGDRNGWPAGGFKSVSLGGYPHQLRVALRANGRFKWLQVSDTAWHIDSLYGEIYRFAYSDVEKLMRGAIADGQVTLDDARSLLGHDWQPFTRVYAAVSN